MFYRVITKKNGVQYLYEEHRWREGKKVRSKSLYIGRVGGGAPSPGPLVPALPFMIAYDLISGRRVEQVKADMAKRGRMPTQGARAWAEQKWTPLTIGQIQAMAPKSDRHTLTAEQRAELDKFSAWIEASRSQEASYPAKGAPTDEEEAMHANWSSNQAAQRDEDLDAYNSMSESDKGDADGKDAEGENDGSDGDKSE